MSCDSIRLVQKQFLCNHPLAEFIWKDLFQTLDEALQIKLVEQTVGCDLVIQYPVKIPYQVAFLKYVIRVLEENNSEMADILYESLCRLTTLQSSDVCYKHYVIGGTGHVVSLRENTNFISNGTTGLQTWQAALALAEYATQQADQFTGKHVLELGSGVGLTGLVIRKVTSAKTVYMSDCHPMVLRNLCENVKFNMESAGNGRTERMDKKLGNKCMLERTIENRTISVLDLPWEDISPEFCKALGKIDVVLAADIVYDGGIFTSLLYAMDSLCKYCGVDEFIFACTVRNADTLNSFLRLVGESQFTVSSLDVPPQENFIWSDKTDIKLYSIKGK